MTAVRHLASRPGKGHSAGAAGRSGYTTTLLDEGRVAICLLARPGHKTRDGVS